MKKIGNTVYSLVHEKLLPFKEYKYYLKGIMSRNDYKKWLLNNIDSLIDQDISYHMIMLTIRYPQNKSDFVDSVFLNLANECKNVINNVDHSEYLNFYNIVKENYDHQNYKTYIFPEEAEILFKYSKIRNISNVLVLGSYYGYFGIWALPTVQKNNGSITFIDIDKNVCILAQKNIDKLGFSNNVNIVNEDAINYIKTDRNKYDLIIIDAEGSSNDVDIDRRGKRIYFPLMKFSLELLDDNGSIFMHNIMLKDFTNVEYLQNLVFKHFDDFDKFLPFVNDNFVHKYDFNTTEGIGIYMKKC